MSQELTLGIITVAALVDSINPCVIGVLIFLVAFMTRLFKNRNKMLLGALLYVAVVYLTYLLLGLGILRFALNAQLAGVFYWTVAIIAILAGFLEIKDYFWYGRGFTLQMIPGAAKRLERFTRFIERTEGKRPAVLFFTLVGLGIFVVLVELPCTGAPYLAILGLLSKGEYSTAIPFLLYYNLVFVLPLIVIVAITYFGTASEKLEAWRKEHRGLMRLFIGIFLILLGVYMIYSLK